MRGAHPIATLIVAANGAEGLSRHRHNHVRLLRRERVAKRIAWLRFARSGGTSRTHVTGIGFAHVHRSFVLPFALPIESRSQLVASCVVSGGGSSAQPLTGNGTVLGHHKAHCVHRPNSIL
jgi:hypothetical protein